MSLLRERQILANKGKTASDTIDETYRNLQNVYWLNIHVNGKVGPIVILGNPSSERKMGTDIKLIYTSELLNDSGFFRKIIFNQNPDGSIDQNDIFYNIYRYVEKYKNVIKDSNDPDLKYLYKRIIENKTEKMKFPRIFKPKKRYLINIYNVKENTIQVLTTNYQRENDSVYFDLGVPEFFYTSLVDYFIMLECDTFEANKMISISSIKNGNMRTYNFVSSEIPKQIDLSQKELYDFDDLIIPSIKNEKLVNEYSELIETYKRCLQKM